MNQEFVWDQSSLSTIHLVIGSAAHVTADMVFDSAKRMKSKRATLPAKVVGEMLVALKCVHESCC